MMKEVKPNLSEEPAKRGTTDQKSTRRIARISPEDRNSASWMRLGAEGQYKGDRC